MNTSKDSRRDPRAKILSLTVRYKSATVADFIEDHSYDVSRGGLFIRTSAPFPTGTLLKFEVRIAEEQRVMTGVGRVTWRREKDTGEDSPAGMGVKFIKIEDDSIELIDKLVQTRVGEASSFEVGAKEQGIPLSDPPSNLRVVKEDRISSRPPPAGDMLDQSALLLKSAIGTLATAKAGSDRPGEERATLPSGQSNPLQKAVSQQDLVAVKGEPSIPPPVPKVSAPIEAESVDAPPAEAPSTHRSSAPELTSRESSPLSDASAAPSRASQAGAAQADAPQDDGPPSSDPSADANAAPNSQPDSDRADKRGKANGKKKVKKEKKRKKKFRYASIPVPKQSLARAIAPMTEPLSLATVTTTPPRKRQTEAPSSGTSSNAIWVVLGLVTVALGIYWLSRSSGEQKQGAVEGSPAVVGEAPPRVASSAKSARSEEPKQAIRVEDLPRSEPDSKSTGPSVTEEPSEGIVTEEVDELGMAGERKPEDGDTPRAPVPGARVPGVTGAKPATPRVGAVTEQPSATPPGAAATLASAAAASPGEASPGTPPAEAPPPAAVPATPVSSAPGAPTPHAAPPAAVSPAHPKPAGPVTPTPATPAPAPPTPAKPPASAG